MPRKNKTFDINLLLKDAGLVASSAAATVSSSAKVLDLGTGEVAGDIIIDASAVEVATGDEIYTICAEVSSSSTFASDIYRVAQLAIGDTVPLGGDVDMVEGRYVLPFINTIGNGVTKRYLRLYTVVAGTVATGVNYTAFLAKK